MYNYLYDNYSKEQIMYFTLIILLIADLPLILFTILDIYKFKIFDKYRINYNSVRKYPNKSEILDGIKHSLFSMFCIILPVSTTGIFIGNHIDYLPFNMNRDIPNFFIFSSHIIFILLLSDILFYFLHRIMHTPYLYKNIHKLHHYYNEPFALTNHYIHPIELIIFFLPPIIPGIILNTHISIMWVSAILMNWSGIIIHSGYDLKKIPYIKYITPCILEHDCHHKYFNYNFGATFNFVDKLLGTHKINH